jgi:quinol monooxygenase YgiN
MYGTLAKLPVKRENRDRIEALMREWERDLRPGAEGVQASYLLWPDDKRDIAYLVAVFSDEPSYRRNAESPAQDAWYRRLREALEDDPHWIDGQFYSLAGAPVGAAR